MTTSTSSVSITGTEIREWNSRAPIHDGLSIVFHRPGFAAVVGDAPRHALLLSTTESSCNPFFHGGCARVWESTGRADKPEEILYVTSGLLQTSSETHAVLISRVALERSSDGGDITAAMWAKLRPPPEMAMPAGMIAYAGAVRGPGSGRGGGGVLYCAQGSMTAGSGLSFMPQGRPPRSLTAAGYYGQQLNSVRAVAEAPDGSLWFTDPQYGFEKGFRPQAEMPGHAYRLEPSNGTLRVVADGLKQPMDICFGPDGQTVYVADGGAVYGFDVLRRHESDFLCNRHIFAYARSGKANCVQCDAAGNVYVGCADGVEIWDAGAELLGIVRVSGGVSHLCICESKGVMELFLCAEQRLWWVRWPRAEDGEND